MASPDPAETRVCLHPSLATRLICQSLAGPNPGDVQNKNHAFVEPPLFGREVGKPKTFGEGVMELRSGKP